MTADLQIDNPNPKADACTKQNAPIHDEQNSNYRKNKKEILGTYPILAAYMRQIIIKNKTTKKRI